MEYRYGEREAFLVMTLLEESSPVGVVHLDHIYPRSKVSVRNLTRAGYSEEKARDLYDRRDSLGNLQLLNGVANQEKTNHDFLVWMEAVYPSEQQRISYLETHFIPTNSDLSIVEF